MHSEIPLLVAIEALAHHDDDRMEHLIRIGVIGTLEPPLTARIESDFYECARILEIVSEGEIVLPKRVRDLLIFKLFDLLNRQLDGVDIAERMVRDITPWIETQFLTAEAQILLVELQRHVTPDLKVDWDRCSAFLKVPFPFKGGTSND